MNKGIKKSSGKWIIFKFWRYISRLKCFKKYLNVTIEILFGNTLVNNKNFNYILKAQHFTNETVLMPFCHQSSIVKRKLLLKFHFDLKYKNFI